MKLTCKIYIVNMVLVFLPLYAAAFAEGNDAVIVETSNEPALMLIAGIGLIGLAVLVRKRRIK